jgi:hypothetical protein
VLTTACVCDLHQRCWRASVLLGGARQGFSISVRIGREQCPTGSSQAPGVGCGES